MNQADFLYRYRAVVTSVYDGDTITVDIDLGMGVWLKKQKLRLYGIDTPELRGDEREEGLKVRDYVRGLLQVRSHDKEIVIQTHRDKTGKYGRWLATVFVDESDTVSLNDDLLQKGMAVVPSYMR